MLITLNAFVALACFVSVNLLLRQKLLAIIVPFFHLIFFTIRPLFALDDTGSISTLLTDNVLKEILITYLCAGLLFGFVFSFFLIVQCFLFHLHRAPRAPALKHRKHSSFIGIMLVASFLVSFFANSLRFDNVAYIISLSDSFQAMMTTSSWALNVLADLPLFFVFAFLIRKVEKQETHSYRVYLSILLTTSLFLLVVRPGTRTGILFVCLYVLSLLVRQSSGRIRLTSVLPGFILLPLLFIVISTMRLGETDMLAVLVGIFGNFVGITTPFDTAIEAIDFVQRTGDYFGFRYTLGAISPLTLIPKELLPFDKMPANFEANATAAIFGGNLNLTLFREGSTTTFTAPASGYLEGGYFGVVLDSLLYSALFLGAARAIGSKSLLVHVSGLTAVLSLSFGYRFSVAGSILSVWLVAATCLLAVAAHLALSACFSKPKIYKKIN